MKVQVDRLDPRDPEERGEGLDRRPESAAHDDDRPSPTFELRDRRTGGWFNGFNIPTTDRLHIGTRGSDDLQPAAKNRLDGQFSIHGVIGHRLDFCEDRGAARPPEFINSLDGAQGAVAVETNERSRHAGKKTETGAGSGGKKFPAPPAIEGKKKALQTEGPEGSGAPITF